MAINQPYVKLDSILKCNVGQRHMLSAALSITVKERHLHCWKCCWDAEAIKMSTVNLPGREQAVHSNRAEERGHSYKSTRETSVRVSNNNMGWWDGPAGKGTCCQDWKTELDPWDPHGGRRVTSASCPDTHMSTGMHTPSATEMQQQKVALVKLRQEDCYKLMDKASLSYSIVYNI